MSETKDLKSHYIQILRDNGIHDEITEVDLKAPNLQGDNFCSSCDCVTVHRKNGEPIELFAKRLIDNPKHNKMLRDLRFFEKETGFFNEIFPELKRIVKSRAVTEYDLDLAPKCFFANEETIVMENLMKRGYVLLDKKKFQDLNQAQFALKNLAKFHAPSFILLTEESNAKELLSKYSCLEDSFLMEHGAQALAEWMCPAFEIVAQLLKTYPTEDSEACLEILKELSDDSVKKCQAHFTLKENDLCHVINHGDCWNNNMMFLQDASSKQIIGQIFIDFQLIRIGSPNLDIGYFFYTSIQPEVRQKEWKNLLQVYYDSLVENVRILQGNVPFSFEDFLVDFKKYFFPGFVFGLSAGGLMEAMDGVGDLNEVEGDLMVHVLNVVRTWLENNPEKSKQNAVMLTRLFQEYKEILNM